MRSWIRAGKTQAPSTVRNKDSVPILCRLTHSRKGCGDGGRVVVAGGGEGEGRKREEGRQA